VIRRRSLVVIVSDFISEPGWEGRLHLLNKRHELLAVRLTDPRERILPDVGLVVVGDAETGEQLEIDTSDRKFRERFERRRRSEGRGHRSLAAAGSGRVRIHRGRPRPGDRPPRCGAQRRRRSTVR
jgi:hypothetical protein